MAKRRTITNNSRSRAVRTTSYVRPRLVSRPALRQAVRSGQVSKSFAETYYAIPPTRRRTFPVRRFARPISRRLLPSAVKKVSRIASFSTIPKHKINICVSRYVRRRVLGALNILGRRGLSGGRWSTKSYQSCRR